jgi:hypothetical protein
VPASLGGAICVSFEFAVAVYPVRGTSRRGRAPRGPFGSVHLKKIRGTQVSRVTCREIANHTLTALCIFRRIGLNEYPGYALIDRTNWARLWVHLFP